VLKGVSVSKVRARRKLKLGIIVISAEGVKLGKSVRSIRWATHQGSKPKGVWSNMGEVIKGVSRHDVREAGDYSNAVPSVGGVEEGIGIRQRGRRKSRGRFRT
jgi:hypothetical protein